MATFGLHHSSAPALHRCANFYSNSHPAVNLDLIASLFASKIFACKSSNCTIPSLVPSPASRLLNLINPIFHAYHEQDENPFFRPLPQSSSSQKAHYVAVIESLKREAERKISSLFWRSFLLLFSPSSSGEKRNENK